MKKIGAVFMTIVVAVLAGGTYIAVDRAVNETYAPLAHLIWFTGAILAFAALVGLAFLLWLLYPEDKLPSDWTKR